MRPNYICRDGDVTGHEVCANSLQPQVPPFKLAAKDGEADCSTARVPPAAVTMPSAKPEELRVLFLDIDGVRPNPRVSSQPRCGELF